ncbi:DUF190 domain-containing protein [Streptacidiphilus fuscans]|uniref:DUF190 domain-containing protein n=1 Tax=Streptacidiphilus fuscans TaxID=2789292 RepID=A0A931FCG5_9ACTN|nr:DUF190 domain-containing protein [Streptacidiphilus fuscans]MBF9068448.1 DUF190 domain-containing protein [Streptacidiphilus fuscans]
MSATGHLRLTVHLREDAQWHHHPAATEIVHRAHLAGLAGGSVFRGVEGFGHGGRVHTARLLDLAGDLPLMVVIVDEERKVRAFVPSVQEVLGAGNGLITLERVEVVEDVQDAEDVDDGDADGEGGG